MMTERGFGKASRTKSRNDATAASGCLARVKLRTVTVAVKALDSGSRLFFKVLKAFRGNGIQYERGAVVDLVSTTKVQGLISQRFLLPCDPEVADATQSPAAETAANLVKRRGRPAKDPQ